MQKQAPRARGGKPPHRGGIRYWWGRRSLADKLQWLIQATLLVVLTISQSWLMEHFRKQVLQAAERRAYVSADGVINGMNMLMVSGVISRPELRKLYIQKMGASTGVLELRIIRARQVQDQFGPGLPEEQARDDLDRLAMESRQAQFRIQEDGEAPTMRAVVPFIASGNFRGTNCLQCHHVASGSVNGATSVKLDLSEDYATIRHIDQLLWAGQVLLQVVLFVLIRWFTQVLFRPMHELQTGMSRIQKNADLLQLRPGEIEVAVRRDDEIGRLGRAFNHMAQTLQQKMHDLHEAREMQKVYLAQSLEEHTRMLALLSAMDIGILFVSRDNWVIHANPTFFSIWNIDMPDSPVGRDVSDLFRIAERRIVDHDEPYQRNPFRNPGRAHRAEVTLDTGAVVRLHSFEVSDRDCDGGGWLWLFEDVTEDRRTAERLTFLAKHDPMTGLRNRHSFHEELESVMAAAQRSGHSVALLLLDLDGFKYVNDTFGHDAGDYVLTTVAKEISTAIRRNEGFFRLGGDEFTLLVPNASIEQAKALAERIVQKVSQLPLMYDDNLLHISASVGISLYPQDARDARELVAHADAAMYQAKEEGRDGWRLYDERCDTSREMLSRMSVEKSIDLAFRNNGLRLHFQGVYSPDGVLSHLEALARMVDPNEPGKLIPPATFIPVAERSGKIRAIDHWVLRETIALLAGSPAVPSIAVNISGRTIDDGRLAAFIREEIAHHDVEPSRLILELTETAAVSDLRHLEDFTRTMRRAGLRVCLDDFGSGFSSFTYLRHIDADILKIDGALVRDLSRDPRSQVLVRAVVAVAQGLGKTTVAEFVEDRATLELVTSFGVDFVQGYLFDRPCADHPALDVLTSAAARAGVTSV